MIEIKNLKKFYELDDVEVKALDDVSLSVGLGEFVVLLGQSGCGKSTLLNILGGMDQPTSGTVTVNGENLIKKKVDQLAHYRREEVGMIFQKFNLIGDMTVLENVMMPLKFSGLSESDQKKKALDMLEKVGLEDKVKSIPAKLSGGQQQRVAIARALINNPQILLCDEPTGNLDSKTGEEILHLLKVLNEQGHTIIMVTHNEDYSKYADKVIKMLDGKVISEKKNDKKKTSAEKFENAKTGNITFKTKFVVALKNLKRRKLRFFLTSFGIAIGAMAIVVLVSFGAGLQREANNSLGSYSQVEEIAVTGTKSDGVSFSVGANFAKSESKKLNDATIADLAKISNVRAVFPSINISGEMSSGDKLSNMYGEGTTPISLVKQETKDKVKYGRFIESDDENGVVIPYGQATALGFEDPTNAIGKEVKIKPKDTSNIEFTTNIIGVVGQDVKNSYVTYIPGQTAINWYKQTKSEELKQTDPDLYRSITVRVVDKAHVSEVKKAIDDKGFGTQSYEDIAKDMNRIFVIMQIVLGVIGGIALLVASLGIVNTMVMSVLERTKEIGIMKAVGARNRDIRSVFLFEAGFIGLFGGLVGLLLGYLGSKLAEIIVNTYMFKNAAGGESLSFYVPVYLSIGVVIFSVIIAAVAGYFPAKRAAKLDPAEALREE